ncbi:MAG: threonine ammonia-lyase [Terriglobales bacterium]
MRADELDAINLQAIVDARQRIAPYLRPTPLVPSATLSRRLGTQIFLKLELLQKTGSFKVRGAFNKMLGLAPGSSVVAVSGGNHGQAVAYAAATLGMTARVWMPSSTPRNYVEATRGYGAEVVLSSTIAEAFAEARAAEQEGSVMVHPFDDAAIIAGQATLGLELLEELPSLTDVIVSIGGGGLATGVAAAVKARRPQARLWGVETEGADAMARALAAGRVVQLEAITSIARTLGAPAVSPLTLHAVQTWFEAVEVVSDAATVAALDFLLERCKLLTEPAAACTLAAAERLAPRWQPSQQVVLVLCGGNLAVADLCAFAPLRATAAGG